MAVTLYRQIVALLLAYGCQQVRQGKGSHEIWQSPITDKRFTVPTTITAKPTANAILKQAGIPRKI